MINLICIYSACRCAGYSASARKHRRNPDRKNRQSEPQYPWCHVCGRDQRRHGILFYEQSVSDPANMNGVLAVLIPLLLSCGISLHGTSVLLPAVTLRANQNVTGLAMTTFGVGFGNFFGGSLIKLSGSDVPSIALSATSGYFSKSLPFAGKLGWVGKVFFSYGFLAYAAILIAIICA